MRIEEMRTRKYLQVLMYSELHQSERVSGAENMV